MSDRLSHFLSLENFQAAWTKVATNQGCAGVDRETVAQFARKAEQVLPQLLRAVANGSYRPLPLRQLFIPKKSGGWRELQVPTVRDRIVQQALLNVLHPIFDPQFEICSFAYRPGRSHRMAVEQISAWQKRGYDWVLDADILQYFNHIGHERLLAEVAERLPTKAEGKFEFKTPNTLREGQSPTKLKTPYSLIPILQNGTTKNVPSKPLAHFWERGLGRGPSVAVKHRIGIIPPSPPSKSFTDLVLPLIEQWLTVGVLTREGLCFPQRGIAQGSVVSPILANIYLDDFDEALLATSFKLVRYADDFVVLARRQPQIMTAHQQVAELLEAMGLRLHPDKTRITSFDRGFRFLGHVFSGDLVLPVKKSAQPGRSAKKPPGKESNLRLVHGDAPSSANPMQQAMVAALQQSQKPIPPPLFVVLGYQVRQEKRVEIKSNESIWRSGMSTLYLIQQGATVKKEQGRYVIKAPKESPLEVPIREVERLLVFGNIQLTTAVVTECLEQQVPVVFMSQLGDYKGHLWSAEYDDIGLEMMQYQRQGDEAFKLGTARAIVLGKLLNSKQLLLRLNRKRQVPTVVESIAGLSQDIAAVEQADSLNGLRGH